MSDSKESSDVQVGKKRGRKPKSSAANNQFNFGESQPSAMGGGFNNENSSSTNFDPEKYLDEAYPELGMEEKTQSFAKRKDQERLNWFKQRKIQQKKERLMKESQTNNTLPFKMSEDYVVSDIRPSKRRKK